jgi:hypothetical protein
MVRVHEDLARIRRRGQHRGVLLSPQLVVPFTVETGGHRLPGCNRLGGRDDPQRHRERAGQIGGDLIAGISGLDLPCLSVPQRRWPAGISVCLLWVAATGAREMNDLSPDVRAIPDPPAAGDLVLPLRQLDAADCALGQIAGQRMLALWVRAIAWVAAEAVPRFAGGARSLLAELFPTIGRVAGVSQLPLAGASWRRDPFPRLGTNQGRATLRPWPGRGCLRSAASAGSA